MWLCAESSDTLEQIQILCIYENCSFPFLNYHSERGKLTYWHKLQTVIWGFSRQPDAIYHATSQQCSIHHRVFLIITRLPFIGQYKTPILIVTYLTHKHDCHDLKQSDKIKSEASPHWKYFQRKIHHKLLCADNSRLSYWKLCKQGRHLHLCAQPAKKVFHIYFASKRKDSFL